MFHLIGKQLKKDALLKTFFMENLVAELKRQF